MSLRHSFVRCVLAIAGIGEDVVGANRSLTLKRRREDVRGARVWKLGEVLAGYAGDRVKREALSLNINDIVEERPKACSREAHPCVGHGLNQPLKVEFSRNPRDGLVQGLKAALLRREVLRDLLLLGNVGIGPEPPRDAPLPIPERLNAREERTEDPVRTLKREHHLERFAGGDSAFPAREDARKDGRIVDGLPAPA